MPGTSTGATASRPAASARGIGWRCPHARDIPPVDGDLEGGGGGHDAGRQRAAGDLDDPVLVAGGGPGVQQLAGAIVEHPGGVRRQVAVLGAGLQANMSGLEALTEGGQGFAGVV